MTEIEKEMQDVERNYNNGFISELEYDRTMRALERELELEECMGGYEDDY